MDKATRIIIFSLIAVFIGGVIFIKLPKNSSQPTSDLDPYSFYEGIEENGGIADHVKGNKDAKVVLYEYADYQCPGCAAVNPWMNELIEEYGDQVALVYRVYLLSYHDNARAAASAVEAAGLQGYWKEYGDLLFANQSEWEYASASDRGDLFNTYFNYVTENKGDLAKFQSDMSSSEVSSKIDFDLAMANAVKISATPSLYLDGEAIDWYSNSTKADFMAFMRNLIDKKLAEAK